MTFDTFRILRHYKEKNPEDWASLTEAEFYAQLPNLMEEVKHHDVIDRSSFDRMCPCRS